MPPSGTKKPIIHRMLRVFLDGVDEFCRTFTEGSSPYFHTSDSIANDGELADAFAGRRLAYSRLPGHPDHSALEQWLAEFDGAAKTRVRSDGMGAVSAAIMGAAIARNIDRPHYICILPLYGGTLDAFALLRDSKCFKFEVTYLDANDPQLLADLRRAIRKNTVAIIGETIGNPTLSFTPIDKVVEIAKNHPKTRPFVLWDETFLFGIVRPLRFGVDCVISSDTKYMVDEATWAMGHLSVSQECLDREPAFWTAANKWAILFGGTLGIFEAWATHHFAAPYVLARMKRHSENAMQVAQFLERHPCVERVIYPGLPSYPWYEEIKRYMQPIDGELCFGGMISFYVKGGLEDAKRFLYWLTANTHIPFKTSLAGADDKLESAVLLSHKSMPQDQRERSEITDNHIRLSIGIGPAKKTIEALDAGLRATIAA